MARQAEVPTPEPREHQIQCVQRIQSSPHPTRADTINKDPRTGITQSRINQSKGISKPWLHSLHEATLRRPSVPILSVNHDRETLSLKKKKKVVDSQADR